MIKAEWQCNGEASLLKFELFSGSNADIKAFAASQGATFDMFAKVPTDVFETKQHFAPTLNFQTKSAADTLFSFFGFLTESFPFNDQKNF